MRGKMNLSALLGLLFAAGCCWADSIHGINMSFTPVTAPGGGVSYYYRIGVTEVSVAQFEGSGLGVFDPNTDYNVYGSGIAPVVNISWHQAAQFCNYLTSSNYNIGAYSFSGGTVTNIAARGSAAMNSLVSTYGQVYVMPTREEWYKAAYFTGSGFSDYANGTSVLPVNEVDAVYLRAQGAGPWGVTNGTLEQAGTLNMMGNVWEWTESTAGGEPYDYTDNGQQMAFHGGEWFFGASFLSSSNPVAEDDRGANFTIGMRIVAIPEPGTLSLMSLSTLGLFTTRSLRRRRLAGKSLLPIGQERFCDAYMTMEEWEKAHAYDEAPPPVLLSILVGAVQTRAVHAWARMHTAYKTLDRRFWDYMVVSHEHRVARSKARKASIKKKALDCLDAFLAKIMK